MNNATQKLDPEEREEILRLNEYLIGRYNETGVEKLLELIAVTEAILIESSPDSSEVVFEDS